MAVKCWNTEVDKSLSLSHSPSLTHTLTHSLTHSISTRCLESYVNRTENVEQCRSNWRRNTFRASLIERDLHTETKLKRNTVQHCGQLRTVIIANNYTASAALIARILVLVWASVLSRLRRRRPTECPVTWLITVHTGQVLHWLSWHCQPQQ